MGTCNLAHQKWPNRWEIQTTSGLQLSMIQCIVFQNAMSNAASYLIIPPIPHEWKPRNSLTSCSWQPLKVRQPKSSSPCCNLIIPISPGRFLATKHFHHARFHDHQRKMELGPNFGVGSPIWTAQLPIFARLTVAIMPIDGVKDLVQASLLIFQHPWKEKSRKIPRTRKTPSRWQVGRMAFSIWFTLSLVPGWSRSLRESAKSGGFLDLGMTTTIPLLDAQKTIIPYHTNVSYD